MGNDRLSYEEVGLRIWKNATLLPPGAHKNLPPLNLSPPSQTSPAPQFLNVGIPPPIAVPLCIVSWQVSVTLVPVKTKRKKYRKRKEGVALPKVAESTRKESRLDLPQFKAPMPLPLA